MIQPLCTLLIFVFTVAQSYGGSDPLPSWNDGAAKKAILEFIQDITQEGSKNFIPIKDRIVAFDEDGTLWVEQPLYVEYIYAIDTLIANRPDLLNKEPFKALAINGYEAIKNFNDHDVELLIADTHAGMTIEEFHRRVRDWLKTSLHPRYKKPFTDLVYQPMLEVMQLFKDRQFEVYIVSGGGQEFMRAFAENLYGLSPGHIIGTTGKVKYEYRQGHPVLYKIPEILYVNNKQGKPEGINLVIGKRPVAAFGNSNGDQQMLEWTQDGPGRRLMLLVHHDDAVREYAYGPHSKIGTFPDALMEEALANGWIVVSMKNDWKRVFPKDLP